VPSGTQVLAVTEGTLQIVHRANGLSTIVLSGADGATYTYHNVIPTTQAIADAQPAAGKHSSGKASPGKAVQAGDQIATSGPGGLPFSIAVPDVHGLVDATEALQSWASGLAINVRSLPTTLGATSVPAHQQILLLADSGAHAIASALAATTHSDAGTAGAGVANTLAGSLASPLVKVQRAPINDSDVLTSVLSQGKRGEQAAGQLLSAKSESGARSTTHSAVLPSAHIAALPSAHIAALSSAHSATRQDTLTKLLTSSAARQLTIVVLRNATPAEAGAMAARLPAGRQMLFVAPAGMTARQAAAYQAISAAHPRFRVETLPSALSNAKVTPASSEAQAAATLTATYTATAYHLDSATTQAGTVLSFAEQQLGKPYKWAAAGPASYDCSGLTMDALQQAGIAVTHNANDQWRQTRSHSVPLSQLQPGDLLFYAGSDGTTSAPGHVGIYVGNGMMIDAPYTGVPVRFDSLSSMTGFAGAADPYGPAAAPGSGVWAAAQLGALSVPAALTQYQGFGQQLADSTWGPSQFPFLYALWERESGWNPAALNPMSGAFGIPQSLPAGKMAAAGADWATDPYTQILWGVDYISAAYGDPAAAWAHEESYGWY
jgi:cell wall-associated NlpC family hydrolase